MAKEYDYLVVGSGLFGSVFAQRATEAGKKCLVIDRRPYAGGNVYCEEIEGIQVHQHGAHVFRTSDDGVWEYVCRFSRFNHFVNSPLAVYGDEVYNLPFNMNTFNRMWGVKTPQEAKDKIADQIASLGIVTPKNLEEEALLMVGPDVYEKLVKEYTEKQWGRDCKDLPTGIISTLTLRFTYDNNYYSATHQGVPIDGYNALIGGMLDGSTVLLGTDYRKFIMENPCIAEKTVFTGMIDEFFDYRLGHLEYRSLRFETEIIDCEDWQGNAVVNYTKRDVPWTRIIEHTLVRVVPEHDDESAVTYYELWEGYLAYLDQWRRDNTDIAIYGQDPWCFDEWVDETYGLDVGRSIGNHDSEDSDEETWEMYCDYLDTFTSAMRHPVNRRKEISPLCFLEWHRHYVDDLSKAEDE